MRFRIGKSLMTCGSSHSLRRAHLPHSHSPSSSSSQCLLHMTNRYSYQRRGIFTIVKQYEQAVVLTLGRLTSRSVKKGGIRLFIPAIQEIYRCDMRTKVQELSPQSLLSSDNVSLNVNAVLYYRVIDSKLATLKIDDVDQAIQQLGQTELRKTLSAGTFEEILFHRDNYASEMKDRMSKQAELWGVQIEHLSLKNVDLGSEEMVRSLAKEAEAIREKTAAMIRADGELEAARLLHKAGELLLQRGGDTAIELRTLQSVERMATEDQQNLVVVCDEIMQDRDALIGSLFVQNQLAIGDSHGQSSANGDQTQSQDGEQNYESLDTLLRRLGVL